MFLSKSAAAMASSDHTKKQKKYCEIAQRIKEKIQAGTFVSGDKIDSEHHMAKKYSVSRQTVRHAISVLEQEGWLVRRQGSGTFVAKPIVQKERYTKTIGVILTDLENYIFPTIIAEMEQVFTRNGYTLLLSMTRDQLEDEQRCLQHMLQNNVDGVIIEPTKSALPNPNLAFLRALSQAGIAVMFINAAYPDLSFPCVRMDDYEAGYLATQCLLDASHTSIAGFFQADARQGHLRYAGYLKALSEAGVPLKSNRVLWYTREDELDWQNDYHRIQRTLKDCTGVVCYNDQLAISLIDLLQKKGFLIPQDLSVVGIDGADFFGQVAIPLTTVKNPIQLLGQTIANNLLRLIENPSLQSEMGEIFSPTLLQRSSVRFLTTERTAL